MGATLWVQEIPALNHVPSTNADLFAFQIRRPPSTHLGIYSKVKVFMKYNPYSATKIRNKKEKEKKEKRKKEKNIL